MWVLTRSDWPVLVNLSVTASIGYFQVAKFDQRMHVLATAWEAEHVLADCADGDEARAIVRRLAQAIQHQTGFLDLNTLEPPLGAASRDSEEDLL